ncbi:UNC-like C-terminal-domain-containing protein [Pilobolus umbonatus]|nr:UNC-like C-terminal-domain-containing protein [Pilobolus umbonatus]
MASDSTRYRSPHVFSHRDEYRRDSYDLHDTSVNIASAFEAANRVHSNQYILRHEEENGSNDILDINNINGDHIKNDPDINSMRQNTMRYSSSFMSEDTDDDYDDIYDELEDMVHNPEEERRMRESVDYLSSPTPSYSIPSRTRRRSVQTEEVTREIETTTTTREETSRWNESILLRIFRICLFELFMVYWIIKETAIRFIVFISMLIPSLFFYPFQSMLNQPFQLRGVISWLISSIFFVCSSYFLYHLITPYFIKETMAVDYHNMDSMFHKWETKLNDHTVLFDSMKKEQSRIWESINSQEGKLNNIQSTLEERIRQSLQSSLPELMLVNVDEKGNLEVSPRVYGYLQNPDTWRHYLEQNEQMIKDYLQNHMEKGTTNALVSKETVMKLITQEFNKYPTAETVHQMINAAVSDYHQDVLHIADFASYPRGARIIHFLTSPTHNTFPNWMSRLHYLLNLPDPSVGPEMAIQPETNVGQCWTMEGSSGYLSILLSEPIHIQKVSIEHPSNRILNSSSTSAPREIDIWGIKDLKQPIDNLHGNDNTINLGRYSYDMYGNPIQTFSLSMTPLVEAVSIHIVSNWGNENHTDIYRIRVHGNPVS